MNEDFPSIKRQRTLNKWNNELLPKTDLEDETIYENLEDGFELYDPFDQVQVPRSRVSQPIKAKIEKKEPENFDEDEELRLCLSSGLYYPKSRPYLSKKAREHIDLLYNTPKNFLESTILHVDFTPQECQILQKAKRKYGPVNTVRFHDAFPIYISPKIPGRTYKDCQKFEADYPSLIPVADYGALQLKKQERACYLPKYFEKLFDAKVSHFHRGNCINLMQSETILFMTPWKYFNETSGDTVCVDFNPLFGKFAFGSTAQDGAYNRVGNLWLGDLQVDTVQALAGHYKTNEYGENEFSTISDLCFSQNGQFLYTGAFDNTVKVWDMAGTLCGISNEPNDRIHKLSLSKDDVLAVACKNGLGYMLPIDKNSGSILSSQKLIYPNALKKKFSASLIEYSSSSSDNDSSSRVVVGYDSFHLSDSRGCLALFDSTNGNFIQRFNTADEAFTSLYMHPSNIGFVASSNNSHKGKVYYIDTRIYQPAIVFNTLQRDINHATISNSGFLVSSSGTDNQTFVWDSRKPNKVLNVLKHGQTKMIHFDDANQEEVDAGVTMAQWVPNGSLFVTGGSDGIVKVWDLRLNEPFIRNFAELDFAITHGVFSPDTTKLSVCCNGGDVYMYNIGNDNHNEFGGFTFKEHNII
ncbi:CLRC ubiquitin ligase complex WD repeat subunit Raf1/Dos1 [Schizosaccharomyces osmophilus]|uniref:CLRC ubiquitin ligase complex WD repeat subunit Raf1/Dos1 n=1 Tax=Schizosaccharomyces osmophilus TaxID=2545709 RepID=A0AAF0AW70_9SCHI|nr:CLRC ubiquitin ligase complex WD repeat subunit Raf1/Dos1 [Schizosaccharomyces osmophilus]WBW74356.1 CLRC ubiquitin ligase complex WD repeat subunit Raf1/Dos1 [Schizosaccharomyces osmophilus]